MLDQDFREFIASLNDNDVRYLVVGGYAVAFHGHPRYTKAIDIWIELEPANAQRVVSYRVEIISSLRHNEVNANVFNESVDDTVTSSYEHQSLR
jgi:hypothetical protein